MIRRLNNWLADKLEEFADWVAGIEKVSWEPPPLDDTTGNLTTSDRITYIPPGEATISIQFDAKGKPFQELFELYEEFAKQQSQAQQFANKIKHDHRLPPLDSADTWKQLGAENMMLFREPSGNYKIKAVKFDDGSRWVKGKVC